MMATLQELIDLTPAQLKAWRRLERAVKDFQTLGGGFYCVLDSISAYNSEHVAYIDETGEHHTDDVMMPLIQAKGLTSFADDWHGFTMKAGVDVEAEE